MEKRKHRSGTKKAKDKAATTAETKVVEAPPTQPEHHPEHSGGGISEALRHQDELVQQKTDEKV
jgi:hypothetical protein